MHRDDLLISPLARQAIETPTTDPQPRSISQNEHRAFVKPSWPMLWHLGENVDEENLRNHPQATLASKDLPELIALLDESL